MAPILPTLLLLAGLGQSAWADAVDDYLNAQRTAKHIPGLSVVVVLDGTVVKSVAYGVSDTDARTPVTFDTVYALGSCTKPVTAVAVLQLVEAGKVDLDAPASRYLDTLPAAWKAITVRQLLTHTSGLPNYRALVDVKKLSDPKYTLPSAVETLLAKTKLDFPPGTKYEYSNTNYHVLGELIEKVSGQTYGAYLVSHQFQAAGMMHTTLADPTRTAPNLAAGYNWDGKVVAKNTVVFPSRLDFGDTGLLSTVNDMAKWTVALASGNLLAPTTLLQMIAPGTLTNGTPITYGLGLVVTDYRGQTLVGHSGAVPGYSSSVFYFRDSKLAAVVLCNLYDTDGTPLTDLLALGVAKSYLPAAPEEVAAPDTEPEVTALLRRTLAGVDSGKVDPKTLTPEMRSALTPDAVAQTRRSLAAAGPLTTLRFLSRTASGGIKLYRYRSIYGTTPFMAQFALTADGKIAGLRVLPE